MGWWGDEGGGGRSNVKKSLYSTLFSLLLVISPPSALASDGKAIGLCLLQQCRLPLAKCITNPNCLANVICINTCNGKEDELGCQIKCGDVFENEVVGEFNKCAVSDKTCVPQTKDDGSYPVPSKEVVVDNFPTSFFNGRYYITAGQNKLFDTFDCQVHFFTETKPGKFYGKLNWRIEEPDGEMFNREAIQEFVQEGKTGHMINHDNEYLHYKDDWYIIDYESEGGKEPPFVFVYYRGSNDAWDGYGGAFVYTKDSKFPESIRSRCRDAAAKVGFDFDKDFTITDNTCKLQSETDKLLLREKFVAKGALVGEKQLAGEVTRIRGTAQNNVKAQKIFFENEGEQVGKAVGNIERDLEKFVKEVEKSLGGD